jgi:hypothetical protein
MSAPSPGPGWWLASDGNWYPQKWEYMRVDRTTTDANWGDKANEFMALLAEYGQQGWELVNYSLDPLNISAQARGNAIQAMNYQSYTNWYLMAILKRPVRPG